MLCEPTVVTRTVNAGSREGPEAWRLVPVQYEPTSWTRSAGLLQDLLNFIDEGEIGGRLAQFDRGVDRNDKASQERCANNCRIGVHGWCLEAASFDEQFTTRDLGSVDGRNGQCQPCTGSSKQQPSKQLAAHGPRLRSWLRHERMTIARVFSEAIQHSPGTCPSQGRERVAVEQDVHEGLRTQTEEKTE